MKRRPTAILEHKSKPLISSAAFAGRLATWLIATLAVLLLSLLIGVLGYRYFEDMAWIDAFLNASMLLGGMGEIDPLKTVGGKLFASLFAIYCGVLVMICGGLLLVPVFHRVLHHFHADEVDG